VGTQLTMDEVKQLELIDELIELLNELVESRRRARSCGENPRVFSRNQTQYRPEGEDGEAH